MGNTNKINRVFRHLCLASLKLQKKEQALGSRAGRIKARSQRKEMPKSARKLSNKEIREIKDRISKISRAYGKLKKSGHHDRGAVKALKKRIDLAKESLKGHERRQKKRILKKNFRRKPKRAGK